MGIESRCHREGSGRGKGSLFSEKIKKCVWGVISITANRLEGVGVLIHNFSTGYSQEPGYPQAMHKVSTGSTQDIHTLLITLCISCEDPVCDSLVNVDTLCMTNPQDSSQRICGYPVNKSVFAPR